MDILIVSLFLAVINNPTMSASVQVFVWTYVLISWGIYLYIGLELLAVDTNLGKLWEVVGNREAWHAAFYWVMKSETRLGNWTTW